MIERIRSVTLKRSCARCKYKYYDHEDKPQCLNPFVRYPRISSVFWNVCELFREEEL